MRKKKPRTGLVSAGEVTAIIRQMDKDNRDGLRFAHLIGDLREQLAFAAGCSFLPGKLLTQALEPLPRKLGGIQTDLLVASHRRSPMLKAAVKNVCQPIIVAYIEAIEAVINIGDSGPLRTLVAQRDKDIEKLAQLRESVKPGPKTPITTQKIRETVVIMVLSKTHAGLSQEKAIQAVFNELATKQYPDDLEKSILDKLNGTPDPIPMIKKWLQRSKNRGDKLICP